MISVEAYESNDDCESCGDRSSFVGRRRSSYIIKVIRERYVEATGDYENSCITRMTFVACPSCRDSFINTLRNLV